MVIRTRIADLKPHELKIIMDNKPIPPRLSAEELSNKFNVSTRTIYNIWDRGELPTGGMTAKREDKPNESLKRKIRTMLKNGKEPIDVADELKVVVRIVKQIQRQMK